MSRWIDENALAYKVAINGDADFINKVTKLMIDAPSIDLCFCRECKWCDDAGKKRALICTNPYIDVDPHPNFFCGYGEREGE